MAIKKYFIDNELYGVDAMNNVVKSLRTTGVDGEIAGSLLVTKSSSLLVSVAPGRGWVEGCCIEVTEAEMRSVPSTGGTYSVVMQLDKTGEQINDIDIAVTSGEETGAHVLAYVTVSSGVIQSIEDKRINSKFNGNTADPNPNALADWIPGDFILLKDELKEVYVTFNDGVPHDIASYMTCNGGVIDMEVTFRTMYATGRVSEHSPGTDNGILRVLVDGVLVGESKKGKAPGLNTTDTFRLNVAAGSVITIQGYAPRFTDINWKTRIYLKSAEFRIGRKADTISRFKTEVTGW